MTLGAEGAQWQLAVRVVTAEAIIRIRIRRHTAHGDDLFRVRAWMFRLAAALEQGPGRSQLPASDALTADSWDLSIHVAVRDVSHFRAWEGYVAAVLAEEGVEVVD